MSRITWVRTPVSSAQFPDSGFENLENISGRSQGSCETPAALERVRASLAPSVVLGWWWGGLRPAGSHLLQAVQFMGFPRCPLASPALPWPACPHQALVSSRSPVPSACPGSGRANPRQGWQGHCPQHPRPTELRIAHILPPPAARPRPDAPLSDTLACQGVKPASAQPRERGACVRSLPSPHNLIF